MGRELIKINDTTYRVEDQYVRFFILIGEEKAAVLDTGVSGSCIKELVKKVTDKEVILINTHGDGDHTSGNGEFESYYISEADYNNCGMQAKYPKSKPIFLTDGQKIDLGNRELEMISIPGHTKGSMAVLDVKNRALFSGDTVQTGQIFMFGGHRDKTVFEDALKKLIKRAGDYDIIYPSHDTPQVAGDFAAKVLEDWKVCEAGGLSFEEVELHGQKVKSYRGENCGFFISD